MLERHATRLNVAAWPTSQGSRPQHYCCLGPPPLRKNTRVYHLTLRLSSVETLLPKLRGSHTHAFTHPLPQWSCPASLCQKAASSTCLDITINSTAQAWLDPCCQSLQISGPRLEKSKQAVGAVCKVLWHSAALVFLLRWQEGEDLAPWSPVQRDLQSCCLASCLHHLFAFKRQEKQTVVAVCIFLFWFL